METQYEARIMASTSNAPPHLKKIRYTGTENKGSQLGHDYEIYILMLSYLHAFNKAKELGRQNRPQTQPFTSYIGTEAKGVSPYEDAIHIEVEDNNKASFYFLQAKYKQRPVPLALISLLHDTGDFALLTLFNKYLQLKNDNEIYRKVKGEHNITTITSKFIMFTNRPFAKDVRGVEIINNFLPFETEAKLYRVVISNDPESVYQQFKAKAMGSTEKGQKNSFGDLFLAIANLFGISNVNQKIPAKAAGITEEDLKDFFGDFVLAVGQPDLKVMKKKVYEELHKITGLKDTDWILNGLDRTLREWSHAAGGWLLTQIDCKRFFENIDQQRASWGQRGLTLNRLVDTQQLGVTFDIQTPTVQAITDFVNNENHKLLLLQYENLTLTEIKLAQVVEKNKYETIFSDIKTLSKHKIDINLDPVNAFRYKDVDYMIITLENVSEIKDYENLLEEFKQVLRSSSSKKIILVTPDVLSNIQSDVTGLSCKDIKDKENSFCHLSRESKEKLNRERAIVFHSHKVSLGAVMDDELQNNLTGQVLVHLIQQDYVVAAQVDEKYEPVKDYYIFRHLYRCIEIKKTSELYSDFQIIKEDQQDIRIKDKDILFITKPEKWKKSINYTNWKKFTKLCKNFENTKNIHWLIEREGKLYWQRSRGSIAKLYRFATYVYGSNNYDTCTDSCYLLNKNILDFKENMVITAEPGMGKSLLLSNQRIQSQNLPVCVMKADLQKEDYSTFLKKYKKEEEKQVTKMCAIKFLYIAMKLNSITDDNINKNIDFFEETGAGDKLYWKPDCIKGFEYLQLKAFLHLYDQKKIVLLLDSFEEAAPNYNKQILDLIEALQETKINRIWVTTRPYDIANELEKRLNTFSYTLLGFSKEDQKEFINKFLKTQITNHTAVVSGVEISTNYSSFQNLVEIRIGQLFAQVGGRNYEQMLEFVATPLHLEMMVLTCVDKLLKDLHDSDASEVASIKCDFKDLNIYQVYTIFFKHKFKILYEDVDSDKSKDKIKYDRLTKLSKEEHGKLALMELFQEDEIRMFVSEDDREELTEAVKEGGEKTGIVTVDRAGGQPRFIHRTYAEYFAAEFLADLLILKDTYHRKYERARHFLRKMMMRRRQEMQVVFKFLNYSLVTKLKLQNKHVFFAALNGYFEDVFSTDNVENMVDPFGRTPIHLFGDNMDREIIKKLVLDYGSAMRLKDELLGWVPTEYIGVLTDGMRRSSHAKVKLRNNKLEFSY